MSVQGASNVKTLLITNDFGPRAGGIETFVMGLLERMPAGSCMVYTSQQGETTSYDQQWLREHEVVVIRDRSRILLPTPRVIASINRVIASEGITHLWFGAAAPLALMTPLLKRKNPTLKSVALTHGHEVWWAKIPPFSLLMRVIGASLDVIGYLAEYTRVEISKGLSKRDRGKLLQIAPGIDLDRFSPFEDRGVIEDLRESLGLQGRRVIISVGRLVHRKGQDRLIEAMAQIGKEFPDAHLLLVGEGPYRQRLEAIADRLGISKSVTFVGRLQLDQLPIHLSLAEIFAMPSRDRLAGLEVEGLGIVYLEASSCGLPVIVGNSGGAPDALIEGQTGLLVDGDDSSDVARALRELLGDRARARVMGERGRAWVRDRWSWDRWAGEFQAALLR